MDALLYEHLKIVPLGVLNLLLGLINVSVLWLLGRAVVRRLADLTEQVKQTNGTVIRLDAWREAHDKQDDERHGQISRMVGSLLNPRRDL